MTEQNRLHKQPTSTGSDSVVSETATRVDTSVALIGTAGAGFGIFLAQRSGLSGWAIGLTYFATVLAGSAVIFVLVGLLLSIPSRRFYLNVATRENAARIRLYRTHLQAYASFVRISLSLLLLAVLLLIPAIVLYTPDRQPWPSYSITQTADNVTPLTGKEAQTSVNILISFPDLTPGDAVTITASHNSQTLGFAIGGAGADGTANANLSVQNIPEGEQVAISVTAPGWSCHGQLDLGNSQLSCGWTR
jgi:hypothetical protein